VTVAELIERLKAFPPDMTVHAAQDHWAFCGVGSVEHVRYRDQVASGRAARQVPDDHPMMALEGVVIEAASD
jgi:hypothetical protein